MPASGDDAETKQASGADAEAEAEAGAEAVRGDGESGSEKATALPREADELQRYNHGEELSPLSEAAEGGDAEDGTDGGGCFSGGAGDAADDGSRSPSPMFPAARDTAGADAGADAASKARSPPTSKARSPPTAANRPQRQRSNKFKITSQVSIALNHFRRAASGRDGHPAVESPDHYTQEERIQTLASPGDGNANIISAVKDQNMVVMVMWLLMDCVGMHVTTMETPGEKSSGKNACRTLGNALLTMICGAISSEVRYRDDSEVAAAAAAAAAAADEDGSASPITAPVRKVGGDISLWQFFVPMQLDHPVPLPQQPMSPTTEWGDGIRSDEDAARRTRMSLGFAAEAPASVEAMERAASDAMASLMATATATTPLPAVAATPQQASGGDAPRRTSGVQEAFGASAAQARIPRWVADTPLFMSCSLFLLRRFCCALSPSALSIPSCGCSLFLFSSSSANS